MKSGTSLNNGQPTQVISTLFCYVSLLNNFHPSTSVSTRYNATLKRNSELCCSIFFHAVYSSQRWLQHFRMPMFQAVGKPHWPANRIRTSMNPLLLIPETGESTGQSLWNYENCESILYDQNLIDRWLWVSRGLVPLHSARANRGSPNPSDWSGKPSGRSANTVNTFMWIREKEWAW